MSNYPGGLDAFTNPSSTDRQSDSVGGLTHSQMHASAFDAIEAIEGELGVNPSGAASTVKDRLDTLDTTVAGKVSSSDSRLSDTRTPTDGSVTTAKLADGSVTSAKIADWTITNTDISNTAGITLSKLGQSGATTNQVPVWNGSAWAPANQSGGGGGGSTSVYVTAPITNSGTPTSPTIGIDQTSLVVAPSQVTGTAVVTDDSRLSDTRTPTNETVTDVKIASGGLSPSKITGTAVITSDSRLSDTRIPTDNSVTAAKIVDGAIMDAEINASAAIAKTKISGTAITAADTGTVTNAMLVNSAITVNGSAIALGGSVSGLAPTASPTFTGTVTVPAGGATSAPLLLQSGTLMTTPSAGVVEYTAPAMFATAGATGRGILYAPQMIRLDATRTKPTNNTTLESLFTGASLGSTTLTNGTLALVANTLYYFEAFYLISTTASGTAGGVSVGFTFSNAQQSIQYRYLGYGQTSSTTQTSGYATVATTTTVTATATTATNYVVELKGWFKTNATTGGTLRPDFAQSVAGTSTAPSAIAGTSFTCLPVQTVGTNVGFGAWS